MGKTKNLQLTKSSQECWIQRQKKKTGLGVSKGDFYTAGLLLCFFLLAPLVFASGFAPSGEVFCTLYNLPKLCFIIVFSIPVISMYGFVAREHPGTFNGRGYSWGKRFNLVCIFIFFFILFISLFFSHFPVQHSLFFILIYGELALFAVILAVYFRRVPLRWAAIWGLVLSEIIAVIIGLLQAFGMELPFLIPILGPASTFGYRNPMAHFLVLVAPFNLFLMWFYLKRWQQREKTLYLLVGSGGGLISLASLGLFCLEYSRTGFIALLTAGVAVWGLWLFGNGNQGRVEGRSIAKNCVVSCGVVVMVASLLIAVPQGRERILKSWSNLRSGGFPGLLENRYYHWGNTVMMIKDHPWLGVGPGQFRQAYPLYSSSFARDPLFNYQVRLQRAHNDYLQLAAECGIPALLVFLLMWGRQFYLLRYPEESEDGMDWRLPLCASLVAYSVIMLFSFPLQMAFSRMFLFFLIALGEARAWPVLSKR